MRVARLVFPSQQSAGADGSGEGGPASGATWPSILRNNLYIFGGGPVRRGPDGTISRVAWTYRLFRLICIPVPVSSAEIGAGPLATDTSVPRQSAASSGRPIKNRPRLWRNPSIAPRRGKRDHPPVPL